jgi:hypothetical protein
VLPPDTTTASVQFTVTSPIKKTHQINDHNLGSEFEIKIKPTNKTINNSLNNADFSIDNFLNEMAPVIQKTTPKQVVPQIDTRKSSSHPVETVKLNKFAIKTNSSSNISNQILQSDPSTNTTNPWQCDDDDLDLDLDLEDKQ